MSDRKELALRLGGSGLCKLLFGPLKVIKESESGLPIAESGVGFSATIDFMLRSASGKSNVILEELIFMAHSFSCYNDFIERLPSFQVTEEEIEYLTKLGHII